MVFIRKVGFVWRQSEFAFFRALTAVDALFCIWENKKMKPRICGKETPQQEELDSFCFEILLHSKGAWRPPYHTQQILCFLREHSELCKASEYQRLYDECIYYLTLYQRMEGDRTENTPTTQQQLLEEFADQLNLNGLNRLSPLEVKYYLTYRKKQWQKES